jgi:hypothetical protein
VMANAPCADAKSCIDVALTPQVAGAWTSVTLRGNDFLHALLWPDGVFRLRSGSFSPETKGVTVQLDSSSVPSRAVMVSLQASPTVDLCSFSLPSDVDVTEWSSNVGALCGYAFDQNCGPDPASCYENDMQCEERAGLMCASCKVDCGGACNSCRSECAAVEPALRSGCVARCAKAKEACASSCQQPFDDTKKACDATFQSCDAALANRCKGACAAFQSCLSTNEGKQKDAHGYCSVAAKPSSPECEELCVGQ